jgi:hypothetical protein
MTSRSLYEPQLLQYSSAADLTIRSSGSANVSAVQPPKSATALISYKEHACCHMLSQHNETCCMYTTRPSKLSEKTNAVELSQVGLEYEATASSAANEQDRAQPRSFKQSPVAVRHRRIGYVRGLACIKKSCIDISPILQTCRRRTGSACAHKCLFCIAITTKAPHRMRPKHLHIAPQQNAQMPPLPLKWCSCAC